MVPLIAGRNHLNPQRIVNVITPVAQGTQTNGVKLILAGSEDLYLFGEEAEAVRAWLDKQAEPKQAEPAPTPATLVTKAEPTINPKSGPRR